MEISEDNLNLTRIIITSSITIKDNYPDIFNFILELSKDSLQNHLTNSETKKIAEQIITKLLGDDEPNEDR